MRPKFYPPLPDRGVTLVETLVTIVLMTILASLTAPLLDSKEPLPFRVNRIASQFRLSRSRAISQTSAYRISATSNNQFVVDRANSCQSTQWTRDVYFQSEDLRLSTPQEVNAREGVVLSEAKLNSVAASPVTNWSLCYDSRGISNSDLLLTFREVVTGRISKIQVFAGGAVQIYDY